MLAVWIEGAQHPTKLKVLTSQAFLHRARVGGRERRGHNWWRQTLLKDPCVYCGAKPDGLDHIMARSKKGADGWENRAPACRRCDSAKKAQPMMVWWVLNRPDLWRPATTRRTATTTRAQRRAIIQELGLTPPRQPSLFRQTAASLAYEARKRRAQEPGEHDALNRKDSDVNIRRVMLHPSIRPN